MITRIQIEGFKSLAEVDLTLGGLNLFVGTNASGKSNLFDALRVLQGIGYGFTVEEILNGKPKSAKSEVWEPIRGGSSKAAFASGLTNGANGDRTISFSVEVRPSEKPKTIIRYTIAMSPDLGCVRNERFEVDNSTVFDTVPIDNPATAPVLTARYYRGTRGRQPHLTFEKSRPILVQMQRHEKCLETDIGMIELCLKALSNTQRIDPSPTLLREYSKAQTVSRMGERGENFAALVQAIVNDESARSAYVSWLQQLTPTELDDVQVMRGALGEPLFALREDGDVFPAQILSDGTLRFAAISAAFFQPDMPGILTIEEIENGIHPSRLRLLVELLRTQSRRGATQVMATTHSPIVLAWLEEKDYETTFLCKRDPGTGASIIEPLTRVPHFLETVRKQSLGELFAEGWLEGAL